MWNEIGKVVFVRGMMEKVYPIYDNMDAENLIKEGTLLAYNILDFYKKLPIN